MPWRIWNSSHTWPMSYMNVYECWKNSSYIHCQVSKDLETFCLSLSLCCSISQMTKMCFHHVKKVASDSPGLLHFAIGLVNSVLNLPNGQVKYFEEFNLLNCEINNFLMNTIIVFIKKFEGLTEMTFGLVNASFTLPEWQAVKITFFAPWFFVFFRITIIMHNFLLFISLLLNLWNLPENMTSIICQHHDN